MINYNTVRDAFLTVCLIVVIILFVTVFKTNRRKHLMAVLLMVASFGLYYTLQNIPVENLFFGFQTPEESVLYSDPNAKILKITQYENDAIALCFDDGFSLCKLTHGSKGWAITNPNQNTVDRILPVDGITIETSKLPDYPVTFVLADFSPRLNSKDSGLLAIDTISDSNNSHFETYKFTDTNGDKIYYYTFTNTDSSLYALTINGKEYCLSKSAH